MCMCMADDENGDDNDDDDYDDDDEYGGDDGDDDKYDDDDDVGQQRHHHTHYQQTKHNEFDSNTITIAIAIMFSVMSVIVMMLRTILRSSTWISESSRTLPLSSVLPCNLRYMYVCM